MHQPKTSNEWEALVRRCGELDVSRKSFCEQEGLSYSSFTYWHRKITRSENPAATSITCVELALPEPGIRLSSEALEARVQSDEIKIPVADGAALVKISGSISLARLAGILEACAGEKDVQH